MRSKISLTIVFFLIYFEYTHCETLIYGNFKSVQSGFNSQRKLYFFQDNRIFENEHKILLDSAFIDTAGSFNKLISNKKIGQFLYIYMDSLNIPSEKFFLLPNDTLEFGILNNKIKLLSSNYKENQFLIDLNQKFVRGEQFNSILAKHTNSNELQNAIETHIREMEEYFTNYFHNYKTNPIFIENFQRELEIEEIALNFTFYKILIDDTLARVNFLQNLIDRLNNSFSNESKAMFIYLPYAIIKELSNYYSVLDTSKDINEQFYNYENQVLLAQKFFKKEIAEITITKLFEHIIIMDENQQVLNYAENKINSQEFIFNKDYQRVLLELINSRKKCEIRAIAPNFELADNYGAAQNLRKHKGKFVVLYFGATWCSPCIEELRDIENYIDNFDTTEIKFYYIFLENNNKEKWLKFIESRNKRISYLYSEGGFKSQIAQNYFIKAVPRTFIIDQDGKILFSKYGTVSEAEINGTMEIQKIKEILRK
jgi:peroxiredoxin